MDLNRLSDLVSKNAPVVGGMLTPLNPFLGNIIGILAKLFDIDSTDIEEITKKIENDVDASLKLKKLENENQQAIYSFETQDRKSARDREEEIVRLTGRRDWVLDFIAISVIMGFFSMCILVSMMKQDNTDHDILYMLVGQLTSGFLMVLSFFFGSSSQMKMK